MQAINGKIREAMRAALGGEDWVELGQYGLVHPTCNEVTLAVKALQGFHCSLAFQKLCEEIKKHPLVAGEVELRAANQFLFKLRIASNE
jgi:DNA-directed RNA polymerase subunit L